MAGPWEDYTPPGDVANMVTAEAQRQNIDPALALRIATQESGLHHGAVSPAGAIGVMQLMPKTAQDLGVDPTDINQNVEGGVRYLGQQLQTFGGDPRLAAAAYNAGPSQVLRHGGVPPFAETQKYVDAVAPSEGADAPPWADYAQAASVTQPATQPASQTAIPAAKPDEGLGFLKGAFEPIDNWSKRLLPILQNSSAAPDLTKMGAGLRSVMPDGLVKFIDNPAGYYAEQAQQGRRPGEVGQFAGNVASTMWMPGGPMANGALTGLSLSHETDAGGMARDSIVGALGGKLGAAAVKGVGGAISGVTDPAVRYLASRGVPMTVGQLAGGMAHGMEDKLTSVPLVGDMIRNAQRRGLEGVNRAAYNESLGQVGEALPKTVDIGRDAYSYTKGRLSHLYDTTLAKLGTMSPDVELSHDLSNLVPKIAQIGDPSLQGNLQNIIKTEVLSRFKGGAMSGEDMKAAQEALGKHIQDLAGGTKWSRDAASVLGDVKSSLEGLASRVNPEAGAMLANINKAYSIFKPIEAAAASPAARDGIFPLGTLGQTVARGRAKSALASGTAPLQALANAASKVLPSSVPDSGTAGRSAMALILGGLVGGGGHGLPVIGPAAIPAAGLIGGSAAAYSKMGQKALTTLATVRNDAARQFGQYVNMLAAPAGTGGAVRLVTGSQ